LDRAQFHPNLDRSEKIEFLRSLTVMCTPALYGEAFGLYVIEAMAAGVPVVQPRAAAFPELLEATGGGILCEPTARSLADGIEQVLCDPIIRGTLGEAGRKAVFAQFGVQRMAEEVAHFCGEICAKVPTHL
jgi:glycosyltransferase involved in cell wall biosynthesis